MFKLSWQNITFLCIGSVSQFKIDNYIMHTAHTKRNLVCRHIDSVSLVKQCGNVRGNL